MVRKSSMPRVLPPRSKLVPVAETLLIAALGGVGLTLVGFPGGLVSGSMLTVAVAALAGRPMQIPLPLARLCFVLVGILLGAVVTPATLKGVATWPLSIALLVVGAICMMGHDLLLALGARLGPAVGVAGGQSGFDGASDGAVRRV
jgi:uncharacterized protein